MLFVSCDCSSAVRQSTCITKTRLCFKRLQSDSWEAAIQFHFVFVWKLEVCYNPSIIVQASMNILCPVVCSSPCLFSSHHVTKTKLVQKQKRFLHTSVSTAADSLACFQHQRNLMCCKMSQFTGRNTFRKF